MTNLTASAHPLRHEAFRALPPRRGKGGSKFSGRRMRVTTTLFRMRAAYQSGVAERRRRGSQTLCSLISGDLPCRYQFTT